MNTLVVEPKATKIEFRMDSMWVELADGRTIGVPLVYLPRLMAATEDDRAKYIISGGGTGLHWDDLDEDISVQGLLLGVGDRTRSAPLSVTSTAKPNVTDSPPS